MAEMFASANPGWLGNLSDSLLIDERKGVDVNKMNHKPAKKIRFF
jgi:hypothetical protein